MSAGVLERITRRLRPEPQSPGVAPAIAPPRCSCGKLATHRVTLPPPVAASPRPFLSCSSMAGICALHYGARVELL